MASLSQPSAGLALAYRMRELSDPRTSWYRSLWGVGSIVAMKEVVEATIARWEGTLPTDGALDDFKINAIETVRLDVGIGDEAVRARIVEVIGRVKGRAENDARSALAELEQLIVRSDQRYIWRWSEALSEDQLQPQNMEFTARTIVAHLLDSGLHQEHVLGWLRSRTDGESIDGLLRDASQMLSKKHEVYKFAIAFHRVPRDARRALLRERDFTVEAFCSLYDDCENRAGEGPLAKTPQFAIALEFEARDPHSALEQLTVWISRFRARTALALGGEKVELESQVLDVGAKKIRTIQQQSRLQIDAIRRRQVYADITDSPLTLQIDDALALLAPQLQSTVGMSAAALWAASEGLLGRVDSKGHEVADRLADIVACAFPRHDAFHLVQVWQRTGSGELHEKLIAEKSNFRKLIALADHLSELGDPGFGLAEDRLAAQRVTAMMAEPAPYIQRVQKYLRRAFRRLYYQRNLVMHAARFDSVSLAPTARIAPGLVAAGVDQIVNGRFMTPPLDPLGLAARAANELALLGTPGTKHPVTLLS